MVTAPDRDARFDARLDARFESVRLLIDRRAGGVINMATDEALFLSVHSPGSIPVIRLYGFEPETLSVGRFQRTAGVVDFASLERDGVDFVRRPSAGQAVLHADELTYSVVLARHHLAEFGKRHVYRFIVPLLIAGIRALGVAAPKAVASGRGERSNPDCFASIGEYEIDASENRKLVGSAQAISRSAVLQHGSIPLGTGNRKISAYLRAGAESGPARPTDVSEQTGRPVAYDEAIRLFADSISRILPVTPSSLTPREVERRDELVAGKYGTKTWNERY
jgi:lipoyl(octanoyl) transferase